MHTSDWAALRSLAAGETFLVILLGALFDILSSLNRLLVHKVHGHPTSMKATACKPMSSRQQLRHAVHQQAPSLPVFRPPDPRTSFSRAPHVLYLLR